MAQKKLLHQKASYLDDCNQFQPWESAEGWWKTLVLVFPQTTPGGCEQSPTISSHFWKS
jgi:hypothetical protein